eukprot:2579794-Ditylum_brightwellii.AAC.1
MQGKQNTNPRKQWKINLSTQINEWRKDGEVILMADINSPLGSEDVGSFLAETDMIDLIGYKHGITQRNSHISGSQQIDLIVGTRNLAETITQA